MFVGLIIRLSQVVCQVELCIFENCVFWSIIESTNVSLRQRRRKRALAMGNVVGARADGGRWRLKLWRPQSALDPDG